MKAVGFEKVVKVDEQSEELNVETKYFTVHFDQKEIFSWALLEDEEEEENIIRIRTKDQGILEVIDEEEVRAKLASEFRRRGIL